MWCESLGAVPPARAPGVLETNDAGMEGAAERDRHLRLYDIRRSMGALKESPNAMPRCSLGTVRRSVTCSRRRTAQEIHTQADVPLLASTRAGDAVEGAVEASVLDEPRRGGTTRTCVCGWASTPAKLARGAKGYLWLTSSAPRGNPHAGPGREDRPPETIRRTGGTSLLKGCSGSLLAQGSLKDIDQLEVGRRAFDRGRVETVQWSIVERMSSRSLTSARS